MDLLSDSREVIRNDVRKLSVLYTRGRPTVPDARLYLTTLSGLLLKFV